MPETINLTCCVQSDPQDWVELRVFHGDRCVFVADLDDDRNDYDWRLRVAHILAARISGENVSTSSIALDYETRTALGLNEKTAFSCMPGRARELLGALRALADAIDFMAARDPLARVGDMCAWPSVKNARRVLAGGPL